jgi:hypothetical protein
MKAKPRRHSQPSSIHGNIKAAAYHVPVVQRGTVSAEDEILGPSVTYREPLLAVHAERSCKRWHELDVTGRTWRLWSNTFA